MDRREFATTSLPRGFSDCSSPVAIDRRQPGLDGREVAAVDDMNLYWSTFRGTGAIMKMALAGGPPSPLFHPR